MQGWIKLKIAWMGNMSTTLKNTKDMMLGQWTAINSNLKIFLITKPFPPQLTFVEPLSKIKMINRSFRSQKNTSLGLPLSPIREKQFSTLDFNGFATKPKKTNLTTTMMMMMIITIDMNIPQNISRGPTAQKELLQRRTTRAKNGMTVMILMLIPLDLFWSINTEKIQKNLKFKK